MDDDYEPEVGKLLTDKLVCDESLPQTAIKLKQDICSPQRLDSAKDVMLVPSGGIARPLSAHLSHQSI